MDQYHYNNGRMGEEEAMAALVNGVWLIFNDGCILDLMADGFPPVDLSQWH